MQKMGIYTFESKWHILVNVTIRWRYTRRHANINVLATSFGNVSS